MRSSTDQAPVQRSCSLVLTLNVTWRFTLTSHRNHYSKTDNHPGRLQKEGMADTEPCTSTVSFFVFPLRFTISMCFWAKQVDLLQQAVRIYFWGGCVGWSLFSLILRILFSNTPRVHLNVLCLPVRTWMETDAVAVLTLISVCSDREMLLLRRMGMRLLR